jgi:hypothetical protein
VALRVAFKFIGRDLLNGAFVHNAIGDEFGVDQFA